MAQQATVDPDTAAARDMAPRDMAAAVTGRLAIATDLGAAPSSRKVRPGASPGQARNLDRRRAWRRVEDAVSLRLADAVFGIITQQTGGGAAVDRNGIGQRLRAADHVRPVK